MSIDGFDIYDEGTIVVICAHDDRREAQLRAITASEPWQWLGNKSLCVEPRHAGAVIEALQNGEGL